MRDVDQATPKETYSAEEHNAVLVEKENEITRLKEQLSWMQKQFFGQKSEKGTPTKTEYDIDLFDDPLLLQEDSEIDTETEIITYGRKKRPSNQERQPFPEHLERKEEYRDIPESERICPCGCNLKKIGEEVSETLEYNPATCYVHKIIRPKYACVTEAERGVQIMHLPKRPVPGRVGASLLSYIFVSKYCDHLPLERIENIFKRQDVKMPKSTMVDYLTRTYELLSPLYQRLHEAIMDCTVINADETTIKVQDRGKKKKCHLGYYWAYIGDKKYLYFDYRSGRSRSGPTEFLADFQGEYIQADEYAGYNEVVEQKQLTRAGCWAHARRKFVKAAESGSRTAKEMVVLIAKLYEIEKYIRENDLSGEDKYKYRVEHAGAQLQLIQQWIEEKSHSHPLKKGLLAEAIGYLKNHFQHFVQYAMNPIFDIDNNIVERSIRQIAVGRKNWLFAGSEEGARRSALMFSLIGTCKLHDVEPYEYLNDVINRIGEYPKENLHHLLPDLWKVHFKK
jgi:transposase